MGVDGLLRQLQDAVQTTHLREFQGQRLVVDALSWLHKACYGCALDLATGRPTDAYVRYMLRKVALLKTCGIQSVQLVFDGQRLPLKANTNAKRQSESHKNRQRGHECLAQAQRSQGLARQTAMNAAEQFFQKSVSITPAILTRVFEELRKANVDFVVAPFESDAQMVWMCKQGLTSAIVTEDSDVLVYCLACKVDSPVLFKLDDSGDIQVLSRSIIHENSKSTTNAFLKKMHHLTTGEPDASRMFVQTCVFAGCDFLDSLPNIGIATALKHVFQFRGAPGHLRVQRILSKLASSGTSIPPNFAERFHQAESIFYHHVVFDPKRQVCALLSDSNDEHCVPDIFQRACASLGVTIPPEALSECADALDLHAIGSQSDSFLGTIQSPELMAQIYEGLVCPRDLQPRSNSSFQHAISTSQTPQESTTAEPSFDSNGGKEDEEGNLLLPATANTPRRKERVVSPDPEAIKRRQNMQARNKVRSMQNLLQSYSSGAQTVMTTPPPKKIAHSLLEQVSTCATRKRSAPDEMGSVDSTKATSLRDLVNKHSRPAASVESPHFFAKKSPSHQARNASTPTTPATQSVKKKNRAQSSSSTASSSRLKQSPAARTTLLNFFQKK